MLLVGMISKSAPNKVLEIQCPIKVQSNGSRDHRTRELFIKTAKLYRVRVL